ncbi:hypothetical protein GCM10009821_08310 [Aeromicrobium halocynthiae]|uniref:Fe/B12 periplasmic-binding domain-containing protein n=1 Tax=Aeromicrobium halocynthiae TaxID=560557 RepID=A0ABN2VY19_9ACTN
MCALPTVQVDAALRHLGCTADVVTLDPSRLEDDPLFCGGHWIPDQVRAAGGEPVGMHEGTASGPTSWEALRAVAPEVLVVAPCGFGLDGASEQARVVAEQVPDATVWAIDGDAMVVRPGPRLVDGVEAIASILHPGVLPPSSLTRSLRA